jgi:3-deoxy-7-phosphoheptulonate synthase
MHQTSGINILDCQPLPAPAELLAALPKTGAQAALVSRCRQVIHHILSGGDPRLLVVVGPCSIHDVEAGREYGQRLAALAHELGDRLVIVMRTYFEKPRTSVGWQGLILDPHLDGSGDIAQGLRLARRFLREMLDLGLPTATEFLDPISPQYLADLVCWAAIGARTAESQMHRQLASGLSMPLGFKNGTEGTVQSAVNAVKAAGQIQAFLGISADGRAAAVRTCGNPDCHVVLRGGASGPNYSATHLAAVESLLDQAGLLRAIMVDCNHDNSGRQPERQPEVLAEVVGQILAGNRSIIGLMIESNLFGGSQPLLQPPGKLRYGVSVTDGCLDWTATERCLRETHAALAPRFDSANGWEPAAFRLSVAAV